MIRLEIDFKDIRGLVTNTTRYSKDLEEEDEEGMARLADFICKRAQAYAPVGGGSSKGELKRNIRVRRITKKTIEIASEAVNPYTGEAYGYIQETGDYSQTQFKRLPLSYEAAIKYGLLKHRGFIFRMRSWAREKAPQLLQGKRWITPRGYTPHFKPAFDDAEKNIDDIMGGASDNAFKKL